MRLVVLVLVVGCGRVGFDAARAVGDAPGRARGAWSDGASFPIDQWNPAEPDDGDEAEDGEEQCAYTASGGWDDGSCTIVKGFICRR